MLIRDLKKMILRTVRGNKLLFALWALLLFLSFFLVLWTVYGYQNSSQRIRQYKHSLNFKVGKTIHVEIRIPGMMPEDSYIENSGYFENELKNIDGIDRVGMYSYSNDIFQETGDLTSTQESVEQEGVPFLYLDRDGRELCQLAVAQENVQIADDAKESIPVYVGADYEDVSIGDCFTGMRYKYIVIGKLKKDAVWLSDQPLWSQEGNCSLNRSFVACLPDCMPIDLIANGFNNIYISCNANKIKAIKKSVIELMQKYKLLGVVKTVEETVDEYIADRKEEFAFVRDIALLCLIITTMSGCSVLILIMQKQKYSLAVYFVNGMSPRWITLIYGILVVILLLSIYILSALAGWIAMPFFVDLNTEIYIRHTVTFGFFVCAVEIMIFLAIVYNMVSRLKYKDLLHQ